MWFGEKSSSSSSDSDLNARDLTLSFGNMLCCYHTREAHVNTPVPMCLNLHFSLSAMCWKLHRWRQVVYCLKIINLDLIMRSWHVTYSLLVLLWLSHAAVVTGCYLRAQISRYPKNSFFHFEGNEQTLSLTFLIPDAVCYLYDQRVCYVFEPLPCWTKILYIFFFATFFS